MGRLNELLPVVKVVYYVTPIFFFPDCTSHLLIMILWERVDEHATENLNRRLSTENALFHQPVFFFQCAIRK